MLPLHQGTLLLKLVADHIVFQSCILVPATYDFACTCCVHTSPSPRNFQPNLLSMWLIGFLQPILHPHIYIGLEIRAGFDFPRSPAFSLTRPHEEGFISRLATTRWVGDTRSRLRCSLGQMFPQLSPTRSWGFDVVRDIPQYWSQATRRDSDHGLPPLREVFCLFELFVSNPHVTNTKRECLQA